MRKIETINKESKRVWNGPSWPQKPPGTGRNPWNPNHAKKWAFGWLVHWIGRNLAPVKVCLGVPHAHGEGE